MKILTNASRTSYTITVKLPHSPGATKYLGPQESIELSDEEYYGVVGNLPNFMSVHHVNDNRPDSAEEVNSIASAMNKPDPLFLDDEIIVTMTRYYPIVYKLSSTHQPDLIPLPTVVLPDATLLGIGAMIKFVNRSGVRLTIQGFGEEFDPSPDRLDVGPNHMAEVYLLDNSTQAGIWAHYAPPTSLGIV